VRPRANSSKVPDRNKSTKIKSAYQRLRLSTSVTNHATLPFDQSTVEYLSRLLGAEHRRRRTRRKTRLLTPFRQTVPVLRWFVDSTRITQLALDNALSKRTCYRYLHEGIDVLKAQAPTLEQTLATAKAAGHSHLLLDGTLIETDACHVPGPTPRSAAVKRLSPGAARAAGRSAASEARRRRDSVSHLPRGAADLTPKEWAS
jgi:hypothetical protein